MRVLTVENMNISVDVPGTKKELVKHVSFSVEKGEILGFVGASGSGKSLTSMAIAHILNSDYKIRCDRIMFLGKRLDTMTEKELREVRGKEISYVFQEPMTSLNPVLTIEKQVVEPLIIHEKKSSTAVERKKAVRVALEDAGLNPTKELLNSYPHQLSGGQRQRVMIAMAMITKPQLLVADEITTALDVETRDVIVNLLLHHRKKYETSIIFISHDQKLVERIADRIITLDHGQIVENTEVQPSQNAPKNYVLDREKVFGNISTKVILEVNNLAFDYVETSIFGKEKRTHVLNDIDFCLYEGETLGIVGKSGSGKSTLVKTITGLQKPNSGTVRFAEEGVRMVFQDPYSSLNPAKSVGWILGESLKLHEKKTGTKTDKKTKQKIIYEMLKSVDLNTEMAYRRISELSGGQRQRVAIACALITRPKIVILDEPVSAIDAAVQEQILELLAKLKKEFGCSYIMISHDPELINRTCDRVLKLENGRLYERE